MCRQQHQYYQKQHNWLVAFVYLFTTFVCCICPCSIVSLVHWSIGPSDHRSIYSLVHCLHIVGGNAWYGFPPQDFFCIVEVSKGYILDQNGPWKGKSECTFLWIIRNQRINFGCTISGIGIVEMVRQFIGGARSQTGFRWKATLF